MADQAHNSAIRQYWQSFVESFPMGSAKPHDKYQIWSFGNTPQLTDELGELV